MIPATLIVTSGPTREWLDPVRFISNPSTGFMGWAIASAAIGRFESVVYISGAGWERYRNVSGALNIPVETTDEMLREIVLRIDASSVLIMAAAPADYTCSEPRSEKIKKSPDQDLEIRLKPTPDILMEVARLNERPRLAIGFAAETNDVRQNALWKLKKKDLDFICANEVFRDSLGFGNVESSLLVLGKSGLERRIGPAPKERVAERLVDLVTETYWDYYATGKGKGIATANRRGTL